MSQLPIHIGLDSLIKATGVSASISQVPSIDINEVTNFSVSATWTGTLAGTVNVLASNDNINFNTLDTYTATTGGGGKIVNYSGGYGYLSVSFTFTSGSGNLTVTDNKKR
jgi:hypothetical protein